MDIKNEGNVDKHEREVNKGHSNQSDPKPQTRRAKRG